MKTASFYLLAYIYLFSLNPIAAAPSPEEQQYIDFCAERFGPDTAIQPAEGGGFQCVMCAGSAYQDPVTGDRKCCNVLNESFSVDKVVQTRGGCCKAPLVFSYDPAAKAGKCCNPGHKFMAGACTPHEPSRPKCTQCSKNYACAHDGHLGLRYGHCYTMTDINGLHLNRKVDGTYQSGGDIDNLIFRVCKSTTDCDANFGRYVPEDGTWALQDQLGRREDTGPGWFGNYTPHMGIAPFKETARAAIFKGEGFCMYGECAVCLRLGNPDQGLSAPCPLYPNSEKAHIGAARNPTNCKAYRFQEIKCIKGVPARPS